MNFMRILILLFIFISFQSFGTINRERYFSVFETKSIDKINEEINALNKEKPSDLRDAFLGAMIMKKAQFLKTPKEKVNEFKKGRVLLESAIEKQPDNIEFRFLRLVIQENCPKILKYNTNTEEDAQQIQSNFSSLNSTSQKYIKKYALHSILLKL